MANKAIDHLKSRPLGGRAADQTKHEIMCATIFLTAMLWLAIMKVFAWLAIAGNSTSREVKRLEIRLSGACEAWRHQPES